VVVPLSTALRSRFAGSETAFVPGQLLRGKEEFSQAASVHAEALSENLDFLELHTKKQTIEGFVFAEKSEQQSRPLPPDLCGHF
jgi:hypothetical protein